MVSKIIQLDQNSSVPKYRQIIKSIFSSIENKNLLRGDKIPSINQICSEFGLSRDTVMMAFNELKAKGIIISQPGKGYYVKSTDFNQEEKVFLLFEEFNSFKEDLYNSFLKSINSKGIVDIFFHHFNYNVFKNLILESVGKYTSYVIMPATFDSTINLINQLPKERVYILDRLKEDLEGYPVIYQDFENDLYEAMEDGLSLLQKYKKLILVNPGGKEPMQRETGFRRFCEKYKIPHSLLKSVEGIDINKNEAYFVINDRHLVSLVNMAQDKKFTLGTDFGIVSFNDTILKQVVGGGITTISTDFKQMGCSLADMVLSKKKEKNRNPAALIKRSSL